MDELFRMNGMLKLNYIICGNLPECERKYLYDNIADRDNEIQMIWESELKGDLTLFQEEEKLPDDFAKFGLFISSDRADLYRAAEMGMATVCYLLPMPIEKESGQVEAKGRMQEAFSEDRDTQNESGYSDFSPDMYVEGFEEVDALFLQHVYERHHHIPWTILETERCIVKEFSMEYLDALFELYAGEGMTDYIEPLYPYEQEKEYQQAYIDNMYAFYGYGMWIVCEKETRKLIGRAGVEHREELDGELELGYAIGSSYQRQGYATEVCEAILTYAREELAMPSVCCLIEEGNTVSEHLAEKLGFTLEGTVQIQDKPMKKYCIFWQ